MTDTCVITTGGGTLTFNATTGEYDVVAGAEVYSGPCRVQVPFIIGEQTPQYGGREVTLQFAIVSIPIAAVGVRVRHKVTITAVDGVAGDPELIGAEYTVVASHHKTDATARRLRCEEVTDAS